MLKIKNYLIELYNDLKVQKIKDLLNEVKEKASKINNNNFDSKKINSKGVGVVNSKSKNSKKINQVKSKKKKEIEELAEEDNYRMMEAEFEAEPEQETEEKNYNVSEITVENKEDFNLENSNFSTKNNTNDSEELSMKAKNISSVITKEEILKFTNLINPNYKEIFGDDDEITQLKQKQQLRLKEQQKSKKHRNLDFKKSKFE